MNKINVFSWKKFFLVFSVCIFITTLFFLQYPLVSIVAYAALFFVAYFSFVCTKSRYYITGNLEKLEGQKEVKHTGWLYLIFALMYFLAGVLVTKSHFLSYYNIIEIGKEWLANIFLVIFIIIIALQLTHSKK